MVEEYHSLVEELGVSSFALSHNWNISSNTGDSISSMGLRNCKLFVAKAGRSSKFQG